MPNPFVDYCQKVDWFTSRVKNLRRKPDAIDEPSKPFFSLFPCEVCGAKAGIRLDLTGEFIKSGVTMLSAVCLDCVYCIEHGKPAHRLYRVK